ncbi:UBX domain protein Ubx2 [Polyrhizophydium stewartii]|uniref:UBX domain protein Ubx2 n=1 Tax=Polyrhizophydium stewartii TaxID=2732419 RepID=A0ABR4N7B9_9FUNG
MADDEAIMNFVEVTGADPDTAHRYLLFAQGDPEAAITLFLESGGMDLPDPASAPAPARRPPSDVDFDDDDDYGTGYAGAGTADSPIREPSASPPPPIPVRREVLIGTDDDDDGGMAGYIVRGRSYPSFHEETAREPFRNIGQETIVSSEPGPSESRQDRLARLFQPPLDIMFQGSFEDARAKARQDAKWLMVTIHDPSEFVCQALNRDLWRDQTVKEMIRENFVFVQFGAQSSEGKMHSTFYPFENHPYIAIIDPRTGERVKIWRTKSDPSEFLVEGKLHALVVTALPRTLG